MKEDPKKQKEGMIRDFLSRWDRVTTQQNGQAKEAPATKPGEEEEEEVFACSVCAAEVPPDARACPNCGTLFVGAPEQLPAPPAEKAAMTMPGAISPPLELGGAPPSLEIPPPEPQMPPDLKKIVLPPPPGEGGVPPISPRAEAPIIAQRRCEVCRAPLSLAADVCLVCGTATKDKGIRRLARPFEPPTDLEIGLPAPVDISGEELEIPRDDSDWKAWLVQGDIYYNAGRVEKAIEAYDTSLRIRASFEAYNNKGLVLYREGLLEEAIRCFDRALELHPNDEFIWFNKGNALRDLGRFKECIESYDRAISLKPDFERAWAATGHALLAEGRSADAVVCFESALRINWNNEQTWTAIGSALFRAGRSEEAETAFKKAVEIRPDAWEAWYELAELQTDLGKMKEALSSLRKVTEHNPGHWRSWLELGGLLGDLGREKEAVACYARAAQLNPGSWQTWRALGHEYLSLKRFNDASRSFDRATKLNPTDASLWLEAAEGQYLIGRPEAALEAADRALAIKQTSEGWLSRGISLSTIGSSTEAISSFEKGLAIDPGSPRLWFEKALVHKQLGEAAEALACFDRALSVNPGFEKALSAKGRLLMELGRGREALECLDKAVSLRPTLDKLENIAHLRQVLILTEAAGAVQAAPAPKPRPKPLKALVVTEAHGDQVVPEVAAEMVPESALVVLSPPESLGAEAVPESEPEARPQFEKGPGEEAPPEFETVEEPAIAAGARRKVPAALAAPRGLSNGRGIVNGNGLTNGRGLSSGRGLTNGRSAVNGTGMEAGRGIINGKGLVNGRYKGEGLINGRGIINGRSLINGTGAINGRGFINGVPGVEGGSYAAYLRRVGRRRSATAGAVIALAVAAMLVVPLLAFQMGGPQGIQIDGDFADWEGIAAYSDSIGDQPSNPSVDIVNFSTSSEGGSAFFRVQAAGKILSGGSEGVDDARIFIDADASSATGYLIWGIGADRMLDIFGFDNRVKGSEVYSFNSSRSREDWNGWYLTGSARAAARGAQLEVGAAQSELGMREGGRYLASVRLDDGRGNTDTSDLLIGNERGALLVAQSGLTPQEISNISAPVPLLALNLTASVSDISITGIDLEPLATTADRPSAITNVSLYLDTGHDMIPDGNDLLLSSAALKNGSFNISIQPPLQVQRGMAIGLLATGSLKNDSSVGSPAGLRILSHETVRLVKGAATLSGGGSLGFVISQLPKIVIDGAFGDWESVNVVNDTDDPVRPDIDILHHAVASNRESVSFYFDVEGEMLGGTLVPAAARTRPAKPGPIGPPTPVAPLPLPVVTGEDTAAIFIDADRNVSTGILVAGMMGAEFSVQITGKEGRVISSAAYRASAGANWSLMGAASAATDEKRLEAQVTFALLGIQPCTVDAVIYTTDWSGQRDYSSEARGRGGELNITARSIAPAVATPGISWPLLALTLTATGGPVVLYSLSLAATGDIAPEQAPRAYLFIDADASSDLTARDLLLPGSQGNRSSSGYRCAPAEQLLVPEGGTRLLFVVVELASGAREGSTFGIELSGPASIVSSALMAEGSFPMFSGLVPVVHGGGRAAPPESGTDGKWVQVAMMARMGGILSGTYGQAGSEDGRAPPGGWPASWTRVTNDSNNAGQDFQDLDIFNLSMMDNSNCLYFKIGLQDLSTLYVNDEWNFYFKSNDSTNNNLDMWYRLSLRVTNVATPTFTSTIYSYTGNHNPPDRGDFMSVNETHAGTGNSLDGTMYGYQFDAANDCILFYAVKSQIYGNLLAPGNTTRVYADTWWVDNHNRWRNYDRSPNGGNTGSYTMVPEFQDIIAPVAGSVLVYVILRRNAVRAKRTKKGGRGA
jgi:tetratricopeptide (TPR) repeat protein